MIRSPSVVVSSPRRWFPAPRRLAALGAGLLLAAGVVVAVADAWRVSGRFPAVLSRQPSRGGSCAASKESPKRRTSGFGLPKRSAGCWRSIAGR